MLISRFPLGKGVLARRGGGWQEIRGVKLCEKSCLAEEKIKNLINSGHFLNFKTVIGKIELYV